MHVRPLSREGPLSCQTCCDTGPRFMRSRPKAVPIKPPFTTSKACRGPILTRIPTGMLKFCSTVKAVRSYSKHMMCG